MDALLESNQWHGQIYSGGWVSAHGGDMPITEPATGAELARSGLGDAEDIARAAATAAPAQNAWAATSFEERAAVLRRAADLILKHSAEIQRWVSRETGAIDGLAAFAVGVASQECYEAAALAHRPLGEILPTNQPRLSLLRRVPVGCRWATRPSPRMLGGRPSLPFWLKRDAFLTRELKEQSHAVP